MTWWSLKKHYFICLFNFFVPLGGSRYMLWKQHCCTRATLGSILLCVFPPDECLSRNSRKCAFHPYLKLIKRLSEAGEWMQVQNTVAYCGSRGRANKNKKSTFEHLQIHHMYNSIYWRRLWYKIKSSRWTPKSTSVSNVKNELTNLNRNYSVRLAPKEVFFK